MPPALIINPIKANHEKNFMIFNILSVFICYIVNSFSCFADFAMVKISLRIIENNPRLIHPIPNSNFRKDLPLKKGIKKLLRIFENPIVIKRDPIILKFLIINESNTFKELKV